MAEPHAPHCALPCLDTVYVLDHFDALWDLSFRRDETVSSAGEKVSFSGASRS